MFYALAYNKIPTGNYTFEHILRDIETLNRWALDKKLEVTALSVHAYAHVARDYALLPFGASIGEKYGPIVVAKKEMSIDELKKSKIAIPGELTTAFLALSIALGKFRYDVVEFDQIFDAVKNGRVDAGLIIHEGQLTYPQFGFSKVLDLGEWWFKQTELPLPLGVNGIRKDLGLPACREISGYLRDSIEFGLTHREEALQYALKYARETEEKIADRFVGMYVNEFTRNLGERGRLAIETLLKRASEAGIVPPTSIDLIE